MGWGSQYQDPAEARAAREAAEAAHAALSAEDARTEALAAAIFEGFALVANAILAAAGQAPAISGIPGPSADTEGLDMG